jgi:colicin import membrane protein
MAMAAPVGDDGAVSHHGSTAMGQAEQAGRALHQLEQALDGCRRRLLELAERSPTTAEVAREQAREDALVVAIAELRLIGRLSRWTLDALGSAERLRLGRRAPGMVDDGRGVQDAVRRARQDAASRAELAREQAVERVERARRDAAARLELARREAAALVERARADSAARAAQRRQAGAGDWRAARELNRRLTSGRPDRPAREPG